MRERRAVEEDGLLVHVELTVDGRAHLDAVCRVRIMRERNGNAILHQRRSLPADFGRDQIDCHLLIGLPPPAPIRKLLHHAFDVSFRQMRARSLCERDGGYGRDQYDRLHSCTVSATSEAGVDGVATATTMYCFPFTM